MSTLMELRVQNLLMQRTIIVCRTIRAESLQTHILGTCRQFGAAQDWHLHHRVVTVQHQMIVGISIGRTAPVAW